jgi:hypothetical protein
MSERAAWIFTAVSFGVPLVFVAVSTTLVSSVDPDAATAAVGYVAAGAWFAALVVHAARTLPATIAGRADFDARRVAVGFAGVVASLAIVVLNGLDVVDAAAGITGEVLVGSFGIAAVLTAMVKSPR